MIRNFKNQMHVYSPHIQHNIRYHKEVNLEKTKYVLHFYEQKTIVILYFI